MSLLKRRRHSHPWAVQHVRLHWWSHGEPCCWLWWRSHACVLLHWTAHNNKEVSVNTLMNSVEKTLNHSHLKDRDRGHDSTGAWTRFSSGESRDQKTVNVQKKKNSIKRNITKHICLSLIKGSSFITWWFTIIVNHRAKEKVLQKKREYWIHYNNSMRSSLQLHGV